MSVIHSAVKRQFTSFSLDDIVVFLKSPREHTVHVRDVHTLFSDTGVTLRLKKCCVLAERIDYLEYVIHPERLETASHTTDTIRKLQTLTSVLKPGFSHGMCNVF